MIALLEIELMLFLLHIRILYMQFFHLSNNNRSASDVVRRALFQVRRSSHHATRQFLSRSTFDAPRYTAVFITFDVRRFLWQTMSMIDIESIALQVKNNCNISDAKFWGYYSPCGLLLRMRDLYRIENNMRPWDPVEHELIMQWIDDRELLWHEIEDLDFQDITMNGQTHTPFDIENINAVLSRCGYMYSAGYGNRLKPVFMLAELSGTRSLDDFSVLVSGREVARDLSIAPAMTRGKTIFARQETMGLFFWDKFEEIKAMKGRSALHRAFREYGITKDTEHNVPSEDLKHRFTEMINEEISTYIHHERGEASLRKEFGTWWKNLLLKIPHSRAEFFVRSLKDVLADTCPSGMLAHIMKNKKTGSLCFYISLLGGFRKMVFPGIAPAYEEFAKTGNWGLIEKVRIDGYKRAHNYSARLKALFNKGNISADIIEQELIP
jgi:hypothetical protein